MISELRTEAASTPRLPQLNSLVCPTAWARISKAKEPAQLTALCSGATGLRWKTVSADCSPVKHSGLSRSKPRKVADRGFEIASEQR